MAEYGTATWKISLWLNNDQDLYNEARENLYRLADWFGETFVDPIDNQLSRLMYQDLLGLVDWDEVASDLRTDEEQEDYAKMNEDVDEPRYDEPDEPAYRDL